MKSLLKLSVLAITITGITTSPVLARPRVNNCATQLNAEQKEMLQIGLGQLLNMLEVLEINFDMANNPQLNTSLQDVKKALKSYAQNPSNSTTKNAIKAVITFAKKLIRVGETTGFNGQYITEYEKHDMQLMILSLEDMLRQL